MPDDASLRHEFQVSTGDVRFKTSQYVILRVFLRHTFLLPIAFRNTCLTEARRLSTPLEAKSLYANNLDLVAGTEKLLLKKLSK